MVFVHRDAGASSSTPPLPSNNKRKLPLFNTNGRLSSLLSLSNSRKSPATCTISLECATINVPASTSVNFGEDANVASPDQYSPPPAEADANAIPFPSTPDCDSDSDYDQLDAAVKVRRRSKQATPRSSLSEEHRTRKDSLERSRKNSLERTRKSSLVTKRKPPRRQVVPHTLLAPASRKAPLPTRASRKRLPHMKQSDLRFLTAVYKSVSSGLDERMMDAESDLQEQDRLFVHRIGELLAERGLREEEQVMSVLTPSQIVAVATLRRRETVAVRNSRLYPTPLNAPERRRSPLASP